MVTVEDELETAQQAAVRLARGTTDLIREIGETILTTVVNTYPATDPIDVRNHKRIVGRVSHPSAVPFTAGKLTFEFSDTEAFTNVTFFQTIDLDVATNPLITKVGATIGVDTEHHVADMDVESMDRYFRVKVRNDGLAEITYDIDIKAKVN